ncbi:MAG: pyridoxal-5'-phosphate-dependent protein [Acidobacteria bacterium]|nr:MAG: pyridoxal-5'-phosphate-dependent protein [Acidobacteriota bacterium]
MEPELSATLVRDAVERIRPLARHTPVYLSRGLNREAGLEVHFKCENLQRGGAFKIRGASNFILSIANEDLPRGVVAYSSGNHAQAVAIAAEHLSARATIVMPADAPRSKIEPTRDHGAHIIMYDRRRESREAIADQVIKETGGTLVPPFDHPLIMAGQGTAALELLETVHHLDALVAPVGGGGLLAGCATIAKAIDPDIRLFGVEPERANDTYLSFQAGHAVEIASQETIADGLRALKPGKFTFPVLQRHVEGILLVSEDEIRATVKSLLMHMKLLVEPSGAVAAAAVMHHKLPSDLRSVGVILSGGNVDFEQLATY